MSSIELLASCASDLDVVNAARVSYDTFHKEMEAGDDKLIHYLMKNKHGCYDDATEVMTDIGWKYWSDISNNDLLLTRNWDGSLGYDYPQRIIHEDYSGEMIAVDSQGVNLLVTPDHNLVGSLRLNGTGWNHTTFHSAVKLLNKSIRLEAGVGWNVVTHQDPFWKLLGFFIGDGYINSSITFHLRKLRKIEYLTQVVKECGFILKKNSDDSYIVHADVFVRNLCKDAYNEFGEKQIPGTLSLLSQEELAGLLDGLINSDGYIDSREQVYFSTTSLKLANQIQELCALLGGAASLNDHPFGLNHFGTKPRYSIGIKNQRNLRPRIGWTTIDRNNQVGTTNYSGGIHCATVPSGIVYIRRNNKPLWCGNSPFEHNFFKFRVEAPIFVFREWMRHRIGHSYNEVSGRYKELEEKFYTTLPATIRTQTGKPGQYKFEKLDKKIAEEAASVIFEAQHRSFEIYRELLELGVAKEQARAVLPVGTYSKMIWSCNARSLMHFLNLRTAPNAMREIRDLALRAEVIFSKQMPITYEAWIENGKVAP